MGVAAWKEYYWMVTLSQNVNTYTFRLKVQTSMYTEMHQEFST